MTQGPSPLASSQSVSPKVPLIILTDFTNIKMKAEEHGICPGCTPKIIQSPQYTTSVLPSSEGGAGLTSSLPSTGNTKLHQHRLPGALAGCLLCLLLPGQELSSFQNYLPSLSSVII